MQEGDLGYEEFENESVNSLEYVTDDEELIEIKLDLKETLDELRKESTDLETESVKIKEKNSNKKAASSNSQPTHEGVCDEEVLSLYDNDNVEYEN